MSESWSQAGAGTGFRGTVLDVNLVAVITGAESVQRPMAVNVAVKNGGGGLRKSGVVKISLAPA